MNVGGMKTNAEQRQSAERLFVKIGVLVENLGINCLCRFFRTYS